MNSGKGENFSQNQNFLCSVSRRTSFKSGGYSIATFAFRKASNLRRPATQLRPEEILITVGNPTFPILFAIVLVWLTYRGEGDVIFLYFFENWLLIG